MSNNKLCPKNLSEWLKYNIDDKELIFTRSAYLFEIILNELENNNLYIGVDNNILMIKLCEFFFKHSYIDYNS